MIKGKVHAVFDVIRTSKERGCSLCEEEMLPDQLFISSSTKLPVNYVGQEVVVFQSVVDVNLFIVDSQSASLNAAFLKYDMKK